MAYEKKDVASYVQGKVDEIKFTDAMLSERLFPAGQTVLDYGCGDGTLMEAWSKKGLKKGYGRDSSVAMIEQCEKRNIPNVDFKVVDNNELDLPDASIDLVITSFVLQTVRWGFVMEINDQLDRVLKPGGRIAHLVTHPCYRDHEFGHFRTDVDRTTFNYFDEDVPFMYTLRTDAGEEFTNEGFLDYHHTLESYVNLLAYTGLRIQTVTPYSVPTNTHFGGDTKVPGYLLMIAKKDESV
jgi:ubiquinone/menaquinone biosynthesis C-methylase UbiE